MRYPCAGAFPVKVLLVDPKKERSRALADELNGEGVQIMYAPTGLYALTMLERSRPNVVMARSHIGDMSGLELCAYLRLDDSFIGVRVVLVAQTEQERRQAIATPSVDNVWTGLAPTLARRLLRLRELATRPVAVYEAKLETAELPESESGDFRRGGT